MYLDATSVIAVALVALVLVFIRISWTLKDIHDALVAREGATAVSPAKSAAAAAAAEVKASAQESAVDEKELAAVIAVAHAAFRSAV
jgi:hypothetical protein